MTQETEEFEPDQKAADLGMHVLVGGQVSCVPPASVPSLEREVKLIWAELNPRFVPLWVTNVWRTPNQGRVTTHHFAIGAHVVDGVSPRPPIKGLLFPTSPVYGRMPKPPIVLYDILDDLSPEERQLGVLPRWEGITAQGIEWARYRAWVDRQISQLQQARAGLGELKKAKVEAKAEAKRNVAYMKKHHAYDFKKAWGQAGRIYVPPSFGAVA